MAQKINEDANLNHKFKITQKNGEGTVNEEVVVKYAEQLDTPHTISGQTFNGTQDIIIPLAATTETGGAGIEIGSGTGTDKVVLKGSGITSITQTDSSTITVTSTEADTLNSVTGRGATTTNGITVGSLIVDNIQVDGNTIQSNTGTLTIDPAPVGQNTGTVIIKGNLQIDGTTTTINSTELAVDDKNITLASGSANKAAADGAGITVDLGTDGTTGLIFNSASDRWKIDNKNIILTGDTTLQNVYDNSSTPIVLTNATNGALTVKRGSSLDTDSLIKFQNGSGTETGKITGEGKITAQAFIKEGGSSAEYLMADGTVSTGTSAQNTYDRFTDGVNTTIADSATDSITITGTGMTTVTVGTDSITVATPTPTLDAVTDAGATTTNNISVGKLTATSIETSGNIKSTVTTGTAPLTVASTTKVTNLNADLLDDQSGAYYLDYNNATNKPTIGDGTLTLGTSGIATGTATFTANQTGNSTFTVTVPGTDLSVGTVTSTNVPINSSTGTDITTLPAATGTLAGILTAGTQTIGGDKTFSNNVVISGDLTVQGTNTVLNTQTVSTEDDIIQLRSSASTAMTGYAGIVATKYDGTNDGALVFNNAGEARIGDVTINGDGSITDVSMQPILTRDESNNLVNNDFLVWDNVNFKAIGKTVSEMGLALANGGTYNEIIITNDDIAGSPLTINGLTGTTAKLQSWKINNTNVAYISNDGSALFNSIAAGSIYNKISASNSRVFLDDTGTRIFRDVADTNSALTVNLANAGANGYIAAFQKAGSTVTAIDSNGTIRTSALYNINSANNSTVSVAANGTTISRNIADANPALTVNQVHASSTGDILKLQAVNTDRVVVKRDGKIGIGLSNPNYNLQIHESSGNPAYFQLTNTTSGSGLGDGFRFYISGLNSTLSNSENGYFRIETNNTERLRILNDGNVGINNPTPTAQLEVISSSTTKVPMIIDSQTAQTANLQEWKVNGTTLAYIDKDGDFFGRTLNSTVTTGTAPLAVTSTTLNTNLNADLLDGQHGSYYASAASIGNATITLAAGNGLVTGGDFTTNQSGNETITLDLGTPSTLSSTSTNAVTADSHTHAISSGSLTGTNISVTGTGKLLDSGLTISIPQSVATTADVTFNSVNVTNLTVTGTLLTKDTQQVNIGDNIILLNAEEAGTPSENAGIEIERGTSTNTRLLWNESNDRWAFTNDGTTYHNIPIPTEYTNNPGTVTSVGLALPAEFTVSNSPVTSSGTLTGAWKSQTAKTFFAAPNAAAGAPSFRTIVASDIPTLNQNTTGSAGSVANALTIGAGLSGTVSTYNGSAAVTISHADSSSQADVTNTGNTVIQSIGLDTYGHVDSIASKEITLAGLGYVAPVINNGTLTLAVAGTGLSGSATFTANQSTGSTFTVTSNATSNATANTIVARDASGDVRVNSKFYYNSNAYTMYNSTDKSIDFVFTD